MATNDDEVVVITQAPIKITGIPNMTTENWLRRHIKKALKSVNDEKGLITALMAEISPMHPGTYREFRKYVDALEEAREVLEGVINE